MNAAFVTHVFTRFIDFFRYEYVDRGELLYRATIRHISMSKTLII